MRLKNFRSAMWVFIAAIATPCTFFCPVSPAVAAPLILATSVQGGCNGAAGIVTVTLNSLTYTFYGSGSQLYFHFDATHVLHTTVNPGTFTLPSGTYNLTITTALGSGGSSSPVYSVTVPVCTQFGSLTVKKTVINNTSS